MKKLLGCLSFVALLMFYTSVLAAPFLVCNPQTNVTSYIVTLDDVEQEVPAQAVEGNSVRLYFDLATVTEGEHVGEVKAKNVWGVSEPRPFYFNKALPECPSVVEISAQ